MVWSDIDIELTKQHDGDITKDLDYDAIINSITNIFKTFQGSRRMLPSFAMPIYNILFEQIDNISISNLESSLLGAIQTWEDRIQIEMLTAIPDEDNNRIDIKFQFRIINDVDDRVFNINENLVMQG